MLVLWVCYLYSNRAWYVGLAVRERGVYVIFYIDCASSLSPFFACSLYWRQRVITIRLVTAGQLFADTSCKQSTTLCLQLVFATSCSLGSCQAPKYRNVCKAPIPRLCT